MSIDHQSLSDPTICRSLLAVSKAIASERDLPSLFKILATQLRGVTEFEAVAVILYDPAQNLMRRTALLDSAATPVDSPVETSAGGWVLKTQQQLVIPDIEQEDRFPELAGRSSLSGIKSYCILPLTAGDRRLGAMEFGGATVAAKSEEDLEFLQQVVNLAAAAFDHAIAFEDAHATERELRLLLEINNSVVSHLDLPELFEAIGACLRRVIPHDASNLTLYDAASGQLRVIALESKLAGERATPGGLVPIEATPGGIAFTERRTVLVSRGDLEKLPSRHVQRLVAGGVRSGVIAPLISHGRALGTLGLGSLKDGAFSESDAELITRVAAQVAIAVDNALAYREIETLKNKLTEEKLYLEEEINTAYNFEEIIGSSPALKRILKQAETVAPTDSTVLIQGETGTGKELMARAIHSLSERRERMMVKLNCAAIPTGLLESELFGHEKGSFTGAIAQRIGRFELAHKGSFFLDEVGEIPTELQPKLLRVLQEQEFERLGSARTQRVDVRLIAATNRDLGQMVAENKFRSDLYYRLNVFPIVIPPLRERPEDIPLLARFFANKFSARMKKQIKTISADAVAALQRYHWPGNIREFEHTIERAVILTQGAELQIPLPEIIVPPKISVAAPSQAPAPTPASKPDSHSLKSIEREHILRVLDETGWVIGGPAGAAVRLGMKRTTLQARMQKLGITRQR